MSKRKFSNDELIQRAFTASIRAQEGTEEGVITGMPIVFDQATTIHDWYGDYIEIIDRHALDKADLNDVRLFVNHDIAKITLARAKKGNKNSTMTLEITDKGLDMTAELDIAGNNEAAAVYSAVSRGDMDGMSFMFRVSAQEWKDLDSDIPTRIIKEISIVHEVSVVNWPAYPQTSVSARSEETEHSALEEARRKYNELKIAKLRNSNRII